MIPTIFTQKDFQDNQGEFCNPAVAHELANMKFKEWVKEQVIVEASDSVTWKKLPVWTMCKTLEPLKVIARGRLICIEEIK